MSDRKKTRIQTVQKYNPGLIEKKWQERWSQENLFKSNLSLDPKYYVLAEFPYPSGDLHMGHWFTFSGADIYARYKRMQGYSIFFPNGFDAFGLPAENAAIQRKIHPRDWTLSNIKRMKQQFATMGASSSFDHEVITCLPEYYKWNQWIFLRMFEKGLAYRASALSNWCSNCQTVLANEGVVEGLCWRCSTVVIQKEVDQWFFKITEYAEKLLWSENLGVEDLFEHEGTRRIDWPKSVRDAQNAWIGKSKGMEIKFKVQSSTLRQGSGQKVKVDEEIVVYTVFPETIFGVTYMVLAPEHPLVQKIVTRENQEQAQNYIKESQKKSARERKSLEKEKTGVFTGSYCINGANQEKVPIWIADYVIGAYGTGAVMGVPGSDHRDFGFARKYKLPIIRVIAKTKDLVSKVISEEDVLEEGYLVNSGKFSGLITPDPARAEITKWIIKKGFGSLKSQYHLHDWSISRQRYWGTPIPIIHCEECGMVPVRYEELPVELPYEVDYTPKGKPPLASNQSWLKVACPKCGKDAKRDPETMDTFVDSSWYFFRYLDPYNKKEPFSKEIEIKMMPVDIYFGGAEHTLGHTLYSRFFTKFFHDIGLTNRQEYAIRRVNHGVILGPDGYRMSKSRGNVVNPDEEVKRYGADTIRIYLAFFMPYEATGPWISERVWGAYRFLQRVWSLQIKIKKQDPTKQDLYRMHKTIQKVGHDIESINFNTAVAALMEWLNYLSGKDSVCSKEYRVFILLLAPFVPHISEELWETMGQPYSVHKQSWPELDKRYLEEEEGIIVVQVNGRVRDSIKYQLSSIKEKALVEQRAKESSKVQRYVERKKIHKVVYVEGKIINFVVNDN